MPRRMDSGMMPAGAGSLTPNWNFVVNAQPCVHVVRGDSFRVFGVVSLWLVNHVRFLSVAAYSRASCIPDAECARHTRLRADFSLRTGAGAVYRLPERTHLRKVLAHQLAVTRKMSLWLVNHVRFLSVCGKIPCELHS